ncbi:glycerol-3-phosphate ABC transporter substrate-binding protein [Nitrospira sp. KM1]|uniref:FecR family protein n=1 Tax=Nitrospira sp. KM1 TaxID=1936990 RepID=UPI0013A73F31|nr:FecR family protein [Nitrospira sp. KM1]BCA56586.1 glycerol-3-phosphate ABC transporter substrate-binding protein [Nitrospira sp. KM1]
MISGDSLGGWFVTRRRGIVGSAMTGQEPKAYSAPKTEGARLLMKEATDWFVRLGASDVTSHERVEFERWRLQSQAHEQAFREVTSLWDESELEAAALHTKAALAEIPYRPRPGLRVSWAWGWGAAAAMLLLCLGWLVHDAMWFRWQADFITATAEQRMIELPDRSTALLNTGSAIAIDFSGGSRTVRLLRGEALFTVQPDAGKPFIVKSGAVNAQAVGTAFAVRANGHDVAVTVTRGLVDVSSDRAPDSAVRLEQGQQVFAGDQGVGAVHAVDLSMAVAWSRGQLVFVRTALSDVLEEVKRYYPGYVLLWSSKAQHVPVTGIYKVSDPARILNILAESLHLELTRMSDRVIVLHD